MSIAFGILLGLCGSIAINTGNNFQSYGMHLLELEESAELKLCQSWYWVVGTAVFIVGAFLNFAAFGFAPQSTLASLGSIQFVCNILFGKWLLEKVITWKMLLGASLAVGGTVLAVCFASKQAAEIKDVQDLVGLWNNQYWLAYIGIIVILAFIIYIAYNVLERKDTQNRLELVLATMYAVFSALFGTLSVVFAKLLAKLLELQAQGINIFSVWYSYVAAVSCLVLMAFWLYRLNSALALYSPLLIIPLLQASFILFSNISGGLYFQEFNYMEPTMWAGFSSGVVIMFIGIFFLVPSMEEDDSDDEFEDSYMRASMLGNKKGMANFFMTGAGRMHQYQWDMKLQKILNERRLSDLGGKKSLSKIEAELIKQLSISIVDADNCMKYEDELAKSLSGGDFQSHEIKELMIKCVQNERTVNEGHMIVQKLKNDLKRESLRNTPVPEEEKSILEVPAKPNTQTEVSVNENAPGEENDSNSSVYAVDIEEGTEQSVLEIRTVKVD